MKTPRTSRSGVALIEVLMAILFIGVFLLALLQIRNQSIRQFLITGDQYTASWLAEMKMNELISEDLPDPMNDQELPWDTGWIEGDFADFDERVNSLNASVYKDWTDRATFARFTYRYRKELIFVGPEFIGTKDELEVWEPPLDAEGNAPELDAEGNPIGVDDPREQPTARLIRITLQVDIPQLGDASRDEAEEEAIDPRTGTRARKQSRVIHLVTYVDPDILYEAEPATEESTEEPR
mgnify:FL=1